MKSALPSDSEKPSLATVADVVAQLHAPDPSSRRRCMEQLERWATLGFPDGADRLILHEAARSFEPVNGFPATPNADLIRLLWNGKTHVSLDDVEMLSSALDEECRAGAMRLLGELGTRTASASLARILRQCGSAGLPKVLWPFLLPLERKPRDPDLLVPVLLTLVAATKGVGPAHAPLLAFAKAGMLTPEQRRVGTESVASQALAAINALEARLAEHGIGHRWDDDYLSVKTDAGLLLDLLGHLGQPEAVSVLEHAVASSEPWAKLWGALGLIRGGRVVAADVLRAIASYAECRIALARQLRTLRQPELFPADFLNQPSLAEAEMVQWLLYPTELGRAPDEIRQLQVIAVDTEGGIADLYVFAFRMHPPHWLSERDWLVGIAGPFLVSDQPTFEGLGYTFSRFERLSEKPLEDHVEILFGTVDGIAGTEG